PAAVAERDAGLDHAIRPDDDTGSDFRRRIDDRRGMNPRHHVSMNANISSASETNSLFTTQRPVAFAIFPRALVISTWMKSVAPGTTGLRNFTPSALMK